MSETTEQSMEYVSKALDFAKEYSLEVEVIGTALEFSRDNKDATVFESLTAGLMDWDLDWKSFINFDFKSKSDNG